MAVYSKIRSQFVTRTTMKIVLENIGKRFNREWILRNISYEFLPGNKYSILGTNGSGKSTLLQIIAGAMSQTEGEIKYISPTLKGESPDPNGRNTNTPLQGLGAKGENLQSPFRDLGLAAPYLELPEEMTWKEAVCFHGKFKKFHPALKEEDVISVSGLESSVNKEIRNFSSGMKQRARLALAILSDTPVLLLDEPATNLDESSVKWYLTLISEFAKEKLVIVCSNYNKEEYSFCPPNSELRLS